MTEMATMMGILAAFALSALAEPLGVTVGGVDVSAGSGIGWTYSNGVLTLNGEATSDLGAVVVGSEAKPVTVTLLLKGENRVRSQANGEAGIFVPKGSTLTIDVKEAGGSLTVQGGAYAAGIGGNRWTSTGTIIINGGKITATGGNRGAGIGTGEYGGTDGEIPGRIVINGGEVEAIGGQDAAGIGGSYWLQAGEPMEIITGEAEVAAQTGSAALAGIMPIYKENTPVTPWEREGDAADDVMTEMGTLNTINSRRDGCDVSAGNLYPVTMRPWGFGGFSPQTTANGGDRWFYNYSDTQIYGIRHTHQPSPWIGDYGAWSFMPITGKAEAGRGSWYSHHTEVFKPYLYRVHLSDFDIVAEVAPSVHGAIARFTYPETESAGLTIDVIDGGGYVKLSDDKQGVTCMTDFIKDGKNSSSAIQLKFVMRFDRPITVTKLTSNVYYLGFGSMTRGEQVTAHIASSFISPEQAAENLRETEGVSFETLVADAKREWNNRLGRIKVETDDLDKRRTFYTCFYRTMLFPMALWERQRDEKGKVKIVHWSPDKQQEDSNLGATCDGYYFAGTGFWDTFRALFPLINFLAPDMNALMMEGLENCYKESGWLPEWSAPGLTDCMIGNNSASVVADAYLSGVRGNFNITNLWEALEHGANNEGPKATGRKGCSYYNNTSYGYVPRNVGINESVARTLEYAYDDWCIAKLGRALGKNVSDYEERANNWRKVFHTEKKIACGRNSDGSFNSAFNPYKWGGDFTEGCAYHYTWSVFHDVPGLIEAMGGANEFERRLDEIFTLPPTFDCSAYGGTIHEAREMQIMNYGQYAHGNQPIQHMIYLYDWVGAHKKAQRRAREVMERFYRPKPNGYCGDEDNGQTSAWYVWSALGFYPVCPGSGEYALGAPLFDRVTITLPNEKKLVIAADGASRGKIFDSVWFGGTKLERPFVQMAQLTQGGWLSFGTKLESVGKGVTAYVNDAGALVVEGEGAVSVGSLPWKIQAESITELKIDATVTGLDKVVSSLPNLKTINGYPVSEYMSTYVLSGEVAPAEATALKVVDGEVKLTVEIDESTDLKNWKEAKTVEIAVPVEGEKGFYILKTK